MRDGSGRHRRLAAAQRTAQHLQRRQLGVDPPRRSGDRPVDPPGWWRGRRHRPGGAEARTGAHQRPGQRRRPARRRGLPRGAARGAGHRDAAAHAAVTRYWAAGPCCPTAWRRASCSTAATTAGWPPFGPASTGHRRGRRRRWAGSCCPDWSTPSHAFHRPSGRTVGDFWAWRRMYALVDRLDPDRLALAAAAFGELVLAGSRPSTSSTTCTSRRGWTTPCARRRGGPACGWCSSTPATCGFAGEPLDPVQRRFSDGDVERWATRAEKVAAAHPRSPWAPQPQRPGGRPGVAGRRGPPGPRPRRSRSTSTCPSSRPRTTPASPPPAARRPSWPTSTGCSARPPRPCTARTSRPATSRCWGTAAPRPACARRPSATWPTAPVRRCAGRRRLLAAVGSDSHAVADLFEEARHRGGRAAGHRPPRAPPARRPARRDHRRRCPAARRAGRPVRGRARRRPAGRRRPG